MTYKDLERRKEYLKEYRKNYNQKPERKDDKDKKVICNCGGNYTTKMKARHERTIKHTEWVQQETNLWGIIEPLI